MLAHVWPIVTDPLAYLATVLDAAQRDAEAARDATFAKDGHCVVTGPFGDGDALGTVQSEVSEAIIGESDDDVPFPFARHIARHGPQATLRRIAACLRPDLPVY
ncbi:hypothetical protein [Actinacidiphila oryziradicis]|uniref:Uncharacterized protein n=1 Tax=Actinacidiphila oryziradicis TaxID=2571141 RepID=A0A4U0S661_9ACTN|nr:hypothetical protein [Actinacidiphila oryziradicis]TKA04556.1 hypothetical protein FCI23_36030 [Actinacidiphila oryziradicis]